MNKQTNDVNRLKIKSKKHSPIDYPSSFYW